MGNVLTPKQEATEICNILYHSSMGDSWNAFIIDRANKVIDKIANRPKFKDQDAENKYWLSVKEELKSF